MIDSHRQMLIIQRAVDDQVRKQAESWRAQTVQQMYAVVLSNLHDKYGFTPEQLVKFFEQCTKDFKAMADKYVKIEDFYGLLNEMGIKVK